MLVVFDLAMYALDAAVELGRSNKLNRHSQVSLPSKDIRLFARAYSLQEALLEHQAQNVRSQLLNGQTVGGLSKHTAAGRTTVATTQISGFGIVSTINQSQ